MGQSEQDAVLENERIFKKQLKLHPENFDVQGGQIPEVEFLVLQR